jgi:cysteine synthase B
MSSIINQIGNTPLVDISSALNKPNIKLLVKLEGNNPGGSVKDRAALNMIQSAFDRGEIKRGDKLVEATSGNTGIALALISGLLGVNMTLIMPENSTIERVKSMRAFGATVILTSKEQGIEGSRDLAENMSQNQGYVMLNQFANEDNWKAHYKTTGPEIWKDTKGTITHFVSAMGTTGTIMGVSTYLKEQNSSVKIIGAQPKDGAKIPGIRKWQIEYLPKIFDVSKVDEILEVDEIEAKATTKMLASSQGIFAGMSSGGAVATALKVADQIDAGVIVAVICDRGDRYLSSELFD